MEKHIIYISKMTKNPNAGQTSSVIPGKERVYFESSRLPEGFVDGENCIIITVSGNRHTQNIKGEILSPHLIELSKLQNHTMLLRFERDLITVEHEPIPKYSVEYEDTDITCRHCGAVFSHKELGSDIQFDGEDEYFYDNICPKCNIEDCCNLEFESIENGVKRLCPPESP